MDSGGGKRAVYRANNNKRTKSLRFSEAMFAAIVRDQLQSLETKVEGVIRRVVAEEVERGLSKWASHKWRLPADQQQIAGYTNATRKLRLEFISNPESKAYTNEKLEGECPGDTIRVRLIDVTTGELVSEGPESAAELEVVPLMGDFDIPDEQDWTADEFESYLVKERKDKGPLLAGELKVYLKGGVGTLGRMHFTDNASWTKSKNFRLGVCIARDDDGRLASIREGKSRAISVMDIRSKGNRKPDVPSPKDEVWRLRRIGRNGVYHHALLNYGISTVQDFLLWATEKPEALKEILVKMPTKDYQDAVNHAQTCVNPKYVYPVNNQPPYQNVLFDHNCQPMGVVVQGQYVGLQQLKNNAEMVQVDGFVKNAYGNWNRDVTEWTVEEPAAAEEPAADGTAMDVCEDVEFTPIIPEADEELMNCATDEEEPDWRSYINSTYIAEACASCSIARSVEEVLGEDNDVNADAPTTPPNNRWWLRIRTAVRCALFIRKAGIPQAP